MKPQLFPATCDRRACPNSTSNWKKDGWIYTSGETIRGEKVLHDHRAVAGRYCSFNCFIAEPVADL